MTFDDVVVCHDAGFAVGVEQDSGRHYVSIPVSNGLVDYEEYYEIDEPTFTRFCADPVTALEFVTRCRQRAMDDLLIIEAGPDRGTAG